MPVGGADDDFSGDDDVAGVGQCQADGLVLFIKRVVNHRGGDVCGEVAGFEADDSVDQVVIYPLSGGGPRHDVIGCYGQA